MFSFRRRAFIKSNRQTDNFNYQDLVIERLRQKSLLSKKPKIFNPYLMKMLKIKFNRID